MTLQELLNFGNNDVITPLSIVKTALPIIEFPVPVNTDGYTNAILRQKLDDLFVQKRRIGRQTELDLLPELGGPLPCVPNGRAHDGEIEESLAAKKRDVDQRPRGGFLKEHVNG